MMRFLEGVADREPVSAETATSAGHGLEDGRFAATLVRKDGGIKPRGRSSASVDAMVMREGGGKIE